MGFGVFFFFSSRRRHTRWTGDWSSDVCSSDLASRERSGSGSRSNPLRTRSSSRRATPSRSEERRVGKSVDLGGRRIIKKKKKKKKKTTSKKYTKTQTKKTTPKTKTQL